jgi:hypothetical protein
MSLVGARGAAEAIDSALLNKSLIPGRTLFQLA